MNWYRHHWWWVGVVIAIGVPIYLLVAWNSLEVLQRFMVAGFLVLLLHEAEEWAWPGGEPAILNTVIPRFAPLGKMIGAARGETQPDRYPSNANSAMVVNVIAAYPIYILAAIFSGQIWLGLFAVFFFWIGQFVFHGIITNMQLKTLYNPGLLTTLLGLSLGIWYVVYVQTNNLATGWDWLGAVLLLPAFAFVVMIKLTFTWLADENSPYRFTDAEMQKWNMPERIARLDRE